MLHKKHTHYEKAEAMVSILETLISVIKKQHDRWMDNALKVIKDEFARSKLVTA